MAVCYPCLQTLNCNSHVFVSTGLLVSACVNRAPEGLLGAAIADVGVHDLLKVHPPTTRLWTLRPYYGFLLTVC